MVLVELHDECSDSYGFPSDALVVVTEYEQGDYEGSGEALVLCADGSVKEYNLGHCSCYGPWENGCDCSWDNFADWQESVMGAASLDLIEAFAKAADEYLKGVK